MKKPSDRPQVIRFVTPGGVTAAIDASIPMETLLLLQKRAKRRLVEIEARQAKKRKTPQV